VEAYSLCQYAAASIGVHFLQELNYLLLGIPCRRRSNQSDSLSTESKDDFRSTYICDPRWFINLLNPRRVCTSALSVTILLTVDLWEQCVPLTFFRLSHHTIHKQHLLAYDGATTSAARIGRQYPGKRRRVRACVAPSLVAACSCCSRR